MKKVLLSVTLLAGSFMAANAQSKSSDVSNRFTFGAGVKVALPIGDFGDASSFGLGVEGQAEYSFAPAVSAVGSVGFTNYFEKNSNPSLGVIPVLVGARYYPTSQFFVGAKLGVAFATNSGGGSLFNYIPQVGYNADNFQIALGYDAFTKNSFTSSSIAATAIYKFK
jgi:hypothetical protein